MKLLNETREFLYVARLFCVLAVTGFVAVDVVTCDIFGPCDICLFCSRSPSARVRALCLFCGSDMWGPSYLRYFFFYFFGTGAQFYRVRFPSFPISISVRLSPVESRRLAARRRGDRRFLGFGELSPPALSLAMFVRRRI